MHQNSRKTTGFVSPFRRDLLKNKVALISGGGTGINFEIARYFSLHGASVVIMGRRLEVLQKSAQELKEETGNEVLAVQGDVRSPEATKKVVSEAVAKFGKIDILVNGAAGNFLCPAEDLSPNAFKTVIEIDLVGTFNMSRAAFEELKKTKGCILNITAMLQYPATPWQAHPSAAKSGVDSLTRSLAGEWGDFGIRVNGVAPGPIIDTEGMSRLSGLPREVQEQSIASVTPIGRAGKKEDVALAALFLCSNETASYVTGETMIVDGGNYLWKPRVMDRETLRMISQQQRKKESPPSSKL